jgi:16S rRNA pseudouridine516 synthase
MHRLDQLLASLGYGSRSAVRALIGKGRVQVRGKPACEHGLKVSPPDVLVDGEALDHPEGILILLNKPAGLVCSHDPAEGPSVYGLIPARWRSRNPAVTSVGRLDKETTGLLLLTDRTALVHRLTSPKHKVAKVYRARLDRALPANAEALLSTGQFMIPGEDTPCAPAELRRLGPLSVEITLTEGRYHQVRRMLGALGSVVEELHRLSFGDLELGDLPFGSWIELPLNRFGD